MNISDSFIRQRLDSTFGTYQFTGKHHLVQRSDSLI